MDALCSVAARSSRARELQTYLSATGGPGFIIMISLVIVVIAVSLFPPKGRKKKTEAIKKVLLFGKALVVLGSRTRFFCVTSSTYPATFLVVAAQVQVVGQHAVRQQTTNTSSKVFPPPLRVLYLRGGGH